jgi:hypothetical protein
MQSVYRASAFFVFSSGSAVFLLWYCCCLRTRLLLASCFVAADSRKTATKQQANKNLAGIWYQQNRLFRINHQGKKILQSLCTHSALLLFGNPIFVISAGAG